LCHCARPPKKDLVHVRGGVSSLGLPVPQPRSGFRLVTVWLAGVSPLATCPGVPQIAPGSPPAQPARPAYGWRLLPGRPGAHRKRREPVTTRATPAANPPRVVTPRHAQARTPAANATRIAEDCVNGVLTKRSNHGVKRTRGCDRRLSRHCRPQQTCGNPIFDPREGCNNPPQLGYPDRPRDCALNRFH